MSRYIFISTDRCCMSDFYIHNQGSQRSGKFSSIMYLNVTLTPLLWSPFQKPQLSLFNHYLLILRYSFVIKLFVLFLSVLKVGSPFFSPLLAFLGFPYLFSPEESKAYSGLVFPPPTGRMGLLISSDCPWNSSVRLWCRGPVDVNVYFLCSLE